MGYIKLFSNTAAYQDYINGMPLLPNVSLVEEDDIVYYNPYVVDYSKEYMYVEALEDGLTVSFTKKASSGSLYYSLDKQEWNELSGSQTINSGEKVYFKGDLVPAQYNGIGTFTISKQYNVAGNIMSLLFADDFVSKTDLTGCDYAFYYLFKNCTTIQSAENLILPATTLEESCYCHMFSGCTSLITAPELPSSTLANSCYDSMFYGCTSLTTAPELPATTLAYYCYGNMFDGCTSLTTAPELPATTLAERCYQNMFWGCTGLTTVPELPATTLTERCYSSMFSGCTSLTTAPELPATSLTEYCYNTMFSGCTSLTTAPELPATTLALYCYNKMFQNCTSLISVSELPATILATSCYKEMFYGCTSLTTAPELPATTLVQECYRSMFYGCTSLNEITMLATDVSASYALNSWVYNVSPTGTFVKTEGVEIETGVSGIPEGWTVQVA